jgi:hypothetical protein
MLRTGDGRQDTGREVNIAIPNDDRLDVSVEDPTRRSITPTLSFSDGLFAYEVGKPPDFDWFHNDFVRLQQRYPTDCSRC